MIRKEVIAVSLDKSLVTKLRKQSNGSLSEYVNRLLTESTGVKEFSLVERINELEKFKESVTRLMRAQGVEL